MPRTPRPPRVRRLTISIDPANAERLERLLARRAIGAARSSVAGTLGALVALGLDAIEAKEGAIAPSERAA